MKLNTPAAVRAIGFDVGGVINVSSYRYLRRRDCLLSKGNNILDGPNS